MRRLFVGVCICILGLCLGLIPDTTLAFAESEIIEEIECVSDSKNISGDIYLGLLDGNAFEIKNGGTLTISNCTIYGNDSMSLESVFCVEAGGKLILNNVSFDTSVSATYGINNEGCIELNGASFCRGFQRDIMSSSAENNSFVLLSAVFINGVALESGYITIKESTIINNEVHIYSDNLSVGRLIVRGAEANVFASKFLNKFNMDFASNGDVVTYLDYVGDGVPSDAKDTLNNNLKSGDIVIASYDKSKLKVGGAFKTTGYCTGRAYYEYFSSLGNNVIIKTFSGDKILNNFEYAPSGVNYIVSGATVQTTLTINTRWEDSDSILTTNIKTFPSGSDVSCFVDIPEDASASNMTITKSPLDDSISVDANLYSNSKYFRSVFRYSGEELDKNITISFVFKKPVVYGELSMTKASNVSVEYGELIVGDSCLFQITKTADCNISEVKFNNETMQLSEIDGVSEFSATISQSNSLVILSTTSVVVVPNGFVFEYGDTVSLEQMQLVESTGENICVSFQPCDDGECGRYPITSVHTDSVNYEVSLADGDFYYSINPKVVDLSGVEYTDNIEVVYSEDFVLCTDLFVESYPSYMTCLAEFQSGHLSINSQIVALTFEINDSNYVFGENSNVIEVTLNVKPKQLDARACQLVSLEHTYNGEVKSATIQGLQYNMTVEFEYRYRTNDENILVQSPIDAGEYLVKATITGSSDFYSLNHTLEGVMNIARAYISLEDYYEGIRTTTITYDGLQHYIDTRTDLLPEHISISSIDGNVGYKDSGSYDITITFALDSQNYECEDSLQAQLIIEKKQVRVSLSCSEFEYTGHIPTLNPILSGVIDGDYVVVNIDSITAITIGEYSATVLGLSSSNYETTTRCLDFCIVPASVDISKISFEPIRQEYDGRNHLPILGGVLPVGIDYQIDPLAICVDVGEYNVKCTFSSQDSNYKTPADMYAKVTILPRPIFVEFELPDSLVADGNKKNIAISFSNVIDGEEIDYNVFYSGDCVLAGKYYCVVSLSAPSNYQIVNTSRFDFTILLGSVSYISEDVNLVLEGEFVPEEKISITNTSNSLNVANAVADIDFKSYASYKVVYNSQSEDVVVRLKPHNISDYNNLCIYSHKNGQLQAIDYHIENGAIVFTISGSSELVLIELDSLNITLIIVSITSALGLLTLALTLLLHFKKKRVLTGHFIDHQSN